MSKPFAATTTFSFCIVNCNQIGFLLSMERCLDTEAVLRELGSRLRGSRGVLV
jgi:hypothetical protein